jgi:two-component system, OmpR family, sensor histidine kinase SaeS
MKGTLRAVALVVLIASAGAIAGLAVGAIMGMSSGDLAHLAVPIAVSTAVTVGAAITANAALRKTSLRYRFVVVAVLGAGIALANLAVMARLMLVSDHDIAIVMLLVVFGAGTAVALAMVLASSSTKAVDRLVEGAGRIGDGDLGTRIGDLNAGPELDALAGSLDAAADRLRMARESETQAEQMRRDLIVAVSHDLRTPLASLRAMVEAIDDGVVQDPSTVRRYAGEMRRSVDQLVTMVDDLFELTQLDAGAIRAETTRASLDDVVRSALAAIEPTAQLKGVEIVADLGAAAGATCSPRLVRVLQNLLVNAVRHTPSDGTIRIEAVSGDRVLTVAVEDTGEGIAAADLERVFEPFFRADPARSGTGAGLGLALAQRIVTAMGGSIEAESRLDVGSRFAVELPAF